MEKRKRFPVAVIIILAGACLMLYPIIANAWNSAYSRRLSAEYAEEQALAIENNGTSYELEYEKAKAYNDTLWPTSAPEDFVFLKEEDPTPEYLECLNILGNGVMGYVSIPKINIEIPIYHGTDAEALKNGAGHLEGTSLPIGGESTHCVLSAHRGLPGHPLFTDLDLMEVGDVFYINVLDETLAYEVESISVVEPEDVSGITITEGEDLCTLLTCTPYGMNTHRLLVTGRRTEYNEDMNAASGGFQLTMRMKMMLVAAAGLIAVILIMTAGRKRSDRERNNR